MKTPKILVVEDNAITLKMVRVTLKGEGFEVLGAQDAKSALALAKEHNPDLVLMDLRLPDMAGWDLAVLFRNEPGMKNTPLIAFTGFVEASAEARIAHAGFNGFAIKPVEPTRLVSLVREHLAPNLGVTRSTSRERRILIVDDNLIQLQSTSAAFEAAGFQVYRAVNGAEALELAKGSPPDVILSDILMPVMDGFKFCSLIKENANLSKIPVVMTCAHNVPQEDRVLVQTIGAADLWVLGSPAKSLVEFVESTMEREKTAARGAEKALEVTEDFLYRAICQLEQQAVACAKLSQQCALQAAAFSVLSTVSSGLAKAIDTETILSEALAQCLDGVGLSAGALYLKNGPKNFEIKAQIGFRSEEIRALDQVIADLGPQLDKGATLILSPDGAAPGLTPEMLVRAGLRGGLLIPLASREESLGVLLLASDSEQIKYEQWVEFAKTLATQFSQAITLSNLMKKLTSSEERYRMLMTHAKDGISVLDIDGTIREINPGMAALLGKEASEVIGKHFSTFVAPESFDQAEKDYKKTISDGSFTSLAIKLLQPSQRAVYADFNSNTVILDGKPQMFAVAHDITERMIAEEQLRQAHKMEAVGQLAGGIAHDFNNILAGIVLFAEALNESLHEIPGAKQNLDQILLGTERGANLVRQLLAFSRKQVASLEVMNLNRSIEDISKMLNRLIGESIEFRTHFDPDLPKVHADRWQVEQVLLNLAVNARDAMPDGGKLTISSRRVVLKEAKRTQTGELLPGEYSVLLVSDTGSGIDPATLVRIFEPFFTTKGVGVGTGLGLSTAFGIVQKHKGQIEIETKVNHGTTFYVYFPICEDRPAIESKSASVAKTPLKAGLVLLVEDDKILRQGIKILLGRKGLRVIEASDGKDALAVVKNLREPLELLITDIVMPELSGPNLSKYLERMFPGLKVIFMTGYYNREEDIFERLQENHVRFIQKPFHAEDLFALIAEISE